MLWREIDEDDNSSLDERSEWYYWDDGDDATHHQIDTPTGGWVGPLQRETNESYVSLQPYFQSVSYHYNDKGQLELDLHQVDSKFFYFYTKYDSYGRVDARDYFWRPAPYVDDYLSHAGSWHRYGLEYSYDASYSYIDEITDSMNRTVWEGHSTQAYDHLGRPEFFRKGNGHWTRRTYDSASNLLTDILTGTSGGTAYIQDYNYKWDGLGNLTERKNLLSGFVNTETFGYDEQNRLTTRNGSSYASYDNLGNIVWKKTVAGSQSTNYTYDSSKIHAVKTAHGYTITYDANGNMVTRTDGTDWDLASWTAYDKPRWLDNGAKGSEFIYGASSQRAVHLKYDKVGSAKHYKKKKIYVGGNFEIDFENQASGTSQDWEMKIARVYVDGPDGRSGAFEFDPQAASSADHKFYVYHQDHLGSIDAITDYDSDDIYDFSLDNASDEAVYSYDAWGKRRDPENWNVVNPSSGMAEGGDNDITPRGFTDHEMLDHVGLVHMNGRIYDPTLGRFLSADPKIPDPASVQGYNRYSYVYNNPLKLVDPDGYSPAWAIHVPEAVRDTSGGAKLLKAAPVGAARSLAGGVGDILDLVANNSSGGVTGQPGIYQSTDSSSSPVTFGTDIRNALSDFSGFDRNDPDVASVETATDIGTMVTGVAGVVKGLLKKAGNLLKLADETVDTKVIDDIPADAPAANGGGDGLIYREGRSHAPQDHGTGEGTSFRDSLSNPVEPGTPGPLGGGEPVFRPGKPFTTVDPADLPAGSVVRDGVPGSTVTPPGHVSVNASGQDIVNVAKPKSVPTTKGAPAPVDPELSGKLPKR